MKSYEKMRLKDELSKLEKELSNMASPRSLRELNDYTIKESRIKEIRKMLYGRHDQVGSGPEVNKLERLIQEAHVKSKTNWRDIYKPLCNYFKRDELLGIAKDEGILLENNPDKKELCRKISQRIAHVLQSF
jgi:hypothetical protein